MKNIKVTNEVWEDFLQLWSDCPKYKELYSTPSKLLKHLIEIAEGEGLY